MLNKIFTDSLSTGDMESLEYSYSEAEHLGLDSLILACRKHVEIAREVACEHSVVNYSLAREICGVYEGLVREWNLISEDLKPWFKAGMFYFALSHDDEPDFQSMDGFDDDCLVLNTCLEKAGFRERCI